MLPANTTTSTWNGGRLPYGISSRKLGMWLFLASDSLTFGALLIAYGYLRIATPDWPAPFHLWPSITMASVMTFALLCSSYTMVRAVDAAAESNATATVRFLLLTMLGGAVFIALHGNEWRGLAAEGMNPTANPWGTPLFGASFFLLTGLHMLHVLTGVVYLAVIAIRVRRGTIHSDQVEVCGLYWHFVDLVWMFIFPLVYLLSVSRS